MKMIKWLRFYTVTGLDSSPVLTYYANKFKIIRG